jgi:hypothetical protein
MAKLTLATAFVVSVSFAFSTLAKPPSERELVEKIVGTWMAHPDEYGFLLKGGIYTYRADKTFLSSGAFGTGSRHLDASIEGKWWIEGNVLYQEVTKSSFPEIVPVGHVYRETILGISNEECWVRDDEGKEHLCTRYKN